VTAAGPADVHLREVTEADLATLFEFQRDPDGVRMAAFTTKDPSDRAAYMAQWTRILATPAVRMRAIVADGRLVGSIVCFEMEDAHEVSYWIDRACWRRGVASRALAAFLREETRRPLHGRAAADNVASIRVLEKCGFVLAGRERGFANARGEEIDEVVMVLDRAPAA
jgi:RimJ/RimL family protein N-acetyltransferase